MGSDSEALAGKNRQRGEEFLELVHKKEANVTRLGPTNPQSDLGVIIGFFKPQQRQELSDHVRGVARQPQRPRARPRFLHQRWFVPRNHNLNNRQRLVVSAVRSRPPRAHDDQPAFPINPTARE